MANKTKFVVAWGEEECSCFLILQLKFKQLKLATNGYRQNYDLRPGKTYFNFILYKALSELRP